jgi:hypothetical protein
MLLHDLKPGRCKLPCNAQPHKTIMAKTVLFHDGCGACLFIEACFVLLCASL